MKKLFWKNTKPTHRMEKHISIAKYIQKYFQNPIIQQLKSEQSNKKQVSDLSSCFAKEYLLVTSKYKRKCTILPAIMKCQSNLYFSQLKSNEIICVYKTYFKMLIVAILRILENVGIT